MVTRSAFRASISVEALFFLVCPECSVKSRYGKRRGSLTRNSDDPHSKICAAAECGNTRPILANGMVIVISAAMSLWLVVEGWLQVPVAGSRFLFLGGACVYVFTVAALGIALGTIASTMAQFGLLSIPVLLVMMLLSGSTTPMESMPVWLAHVMNVISPTPHFVVFAQDVLYRGADFSIVWPEILATFAIGSVYLGYALYRFRRVIFGG